MFGSGPGGGDVYARRRLLAVLAVVVLLALLVPRACQALLGSNEEAGQGEGQKSGAAGKAAGAGAEDDAAGDAGTGNADTGNAEKSGTQPKPGTQDDSSGRGAPFVEDKPGAGDRSGEAGEEAAPDLGVMVANLAVIDGSEEFASSEDQGAAESAPESSETGSEQPISEVQFALAASPAPTQQPSSEPEMQQPSPRPQPAPARQPEPEAAAPAGPAPARRPEPEAAAPAGPAPAPLGEQIRDRANRRVTAALAGTATLEEVGAPQTAVEPVAPIAAEPVAAVPAPPIPAPPTPAPVAPAPAASTFAPTPAAGALNGTPTVPAAKPNLPAGPRLAAVGPRRIPGPAF
jgi:hypothetical protein